MQPKLLYFINKFINNSSIVSSTKIDSTIKAIINNFINNYNKNNYIYIKYLNILRIVYYFKRLKYYNYNSFKKQLGKYTF